MHSTTVGPVHLFVGVENRLLNNTPSYNLLMPISCHCVDYKAPLFTHYELLYK